MLSHFIYYMAINLYCYFSVVSKLFSESVASSMEFFRRRPEGTKLKDAEGTIAFTRRMNRLFDSLNLQRPEQVAQTGPGQLNVCFHASMSLHF